MFVLFRLSLRLLLALFFVCFAGFAQAALPEFPLAGPEIYPYIRPDYHALPPAPAKYHIGIITATVNQSEDEIRGAEDMIQRYGEVKDGGLIQHLTYPNNFMVEQETTISQIVSLAKDPRMKAIIMNHAINGTTEGFRRVREIRPDILLLGGVPLEGPMSVGKTADLLVSNDFVSAGYRIVWAAKKLGAKTFVYISFPRHMSIERLLRRRMIIEQACQDLRIKFVFESAPDPLSDLGVVGAQQFVLENVPKWVKKYGKETNFFATNDAHTEPLIREVAEHGAIFVEAELPSPLLGYPGAFGVDLKAEHGDFPAIMNKIESVIVAKGGGARLGTWSYSLAYSTSAGLIEHAVNVIEGRSNVTNLQDIFKAFSKYTPGVKWGGSHYVDGTTGTKMNNFAMLLQDTYIFGMGYIHSAKIHVPEKYLKMSPNHQKK